jgi:hypothetical protein
MARPKQPNLTRIAVKREEILVHRFPQYELDFHDTLMEYYDGVIPESFDTKFCDLVVERHLVDIEPFVGLSDVAREKAKNEWGSLEPNLLSRHLTSAWLAEMAEFEAHLKALSPPDLQQLYRDVESTTISEGVETKRTTEATYFFHDAAADARFEFWKKMSLWEVDEAAALSLGKDPSVVSQATLRKRLNRSHHRSVFVDEYNQRLQTIRRAVDAKTLETPINAARFTKWATEMDLEIPEELRSEPLNNRRAKQSRSSVSVEHKQLVSTYKIIVGLAEHLSKGLSHKEASALSSALELTKHRLDQGTVKNIIQVAR